MELNTEIEVMILEAAEKVFYRKGKDGASMQDIAGEAGITRTSLNYYYRSKDKLFEAVFRNTMAQFVPKLAELMQSEVSLQGYLSGMVGIIIDSMLEKPHIPVFVLQELTSNPQRVPELINELGIDTTSALERFRKEGEMEQWPFDLRHMIMNVLSMCIFPFAAKPMVVSVLYNNDEAAYIKGMSERKTMIPIMIQNMLKSNPS
jgi:TetR/AcrR family transcriptional regulator